MAEAKLVFEQLRSVEEGDTVDFPGAAWRKSSRGAGNNDVRVEISLSPLAIGVRDSKNPTAHPIVAPPAWEPPTKPPTAWS